MAADAVNGSDQRAPCPPGDRSAPPATQDPPATSTPHASRSVDTSGVVMTHEIRKQPKRPRGTGYLRMINQFEFVNRVGKGQHGDVWLAYDTSKGNMEVAIKAVKRKNPKVDRMSKLRKRNLPASPHTRLTDQLGSTEQKIKKEIAIMKKCNHPHVVRLLEVVDDQLHERIYMVMEYLGGGEIKWRNSRDEPTLRVDQTRRICRDVILGLEYLHHQGIIHRDIKPANLLWSSDRRTVKITDFGVSHLSVAQSLARHGKGSAPMDEMDAILMDDSDLSKTAGTPLFLAPEIVADTPFDDAGSNATTIPVRKQPITKAIDVWAFGVTLYGLLFGVLPFMSSTEYDIYRIIRHQDWDPLDTMGVDRIPAGPRYSRTPNDNSEGTLAMNLLHCLLEKDARKRITLTQVKKHPWILKDLEDPQAWLKETVFDLEEAVNVTAAETRSAVSSVRFRWTFRIASSVASMARKLRPARSFRRGQRAAVEDKTNNLGARSAPQEGRLIARRQSTGTTLQQARHDREARAEKGAKSQILAQDIDITARPPSEHLEFYTIWDHPNAGSNPPSKPRRGSLPQHNSKKPDMSLLVPGLTQRSGSALTSPRSLSQASSPGEPFGAQSPHERPRSRNSLQALMRNLLPGRHAPPAPLEAGPSLSGPVSDLASHPASARTSIGRRAESLLGRRSSEAFSQATSRQSSGSGPLTLAMRAASWGEVADYGRPSEDLASLYSGERPDETIDEETYLVGAGGVAQSPVPSIPSGGLSTVSSTVSLTQPISAAHAIFQRNEAVVDYPPPVAEPPGHVRARTTSPLAHMSFQGRRYDEEASFDNDFDDDSDDDSMFGDTHSESSEPDVEQQPSTSELYQQEDEDDDEESDDENFHLEVRTRRPSASAVDMSPPRRSASRHGDRAAICI